MPIYIRDIILQDNIKEQFIFEDETMSNLSKINILIGPNNTGKSRLMRSLFSLKAISFNPRQFLINDLNKYFSEVPNDIHTNARAANYNTEGIMNALKKRKTLESIWEGSNWNDPHKGIFTQNIVTDEAQLANPERWAQLTRRLHHVSQKHALKIDSITNGLPENIKYWKIYIPTLRGLRPLTAGGNVANYTERTTEDYFRDENGGNLLKENHQVFSGDSMHRLFMEHWLGDPEQRDLVRRYEEFLSKEFFQDKEIALIPRLDKDVLSIKIDKEEYPIYKLGDGIQHIIIMTLPVFLKDPDEKILLFIEEPEIYLHPGLQRQFINTLLSDRFDNVQVFLTTHSNHLLDLTLDGEDVSVYKLQKDRSNSDSDNPNPKFSVNSSYKNDRSLLEEIGARNSSVFLTNCTIWVEGISDRLYFRKYFEIYQNEMKKEKIFKEDRHFSFVEYSGNNITHWSFLNEDTGIDVKSLCGTAFLIADQDGERKKDRNLKLEKSLGTDHYYRLKCREVENLKTPAILRDTIRNFIGEVELSESFSQNTYKAKYMGKFIDDKIIIGECKRKFRVSDKAIPSSGALRGKADFAKKAVKHINKLADMSDEAIQICKKLYKFVSEHNQ